jgi:metallo-beta-lactamase class B
VRRRRIASLALLAIGPQLVAQQTPEERVSWNRPFKPFNIVGNIYYVGVQGVSAFLITTPQGSILLDGGFPESAPLIEKNISDLGFRLQDVKFLLNSHAHYDHCGGLTELKKRSGAIMIASAGDSTASTGIRRLNCADDERSFPDGKTHHVVFYCSTTVAANKLVNNPDDPNIVADYQETFAKPKRLPCDVFLGPHSGFFNRDAKLAAIQRGQKDAFIDPNELQKYVKQSERDFRKELAQQKR